MHDSYYENLKAEIKRVDYSEGVFVGYRGYDRSGKEPFYPFGYGLSYSTFAYSNLAVEKSFQSIYRLLPVHPPVRDTMPSKSLLQPHAKR